MPLLRRKRFSLEPAPSNLRADEEVFYVEATGEIFRDYTNFFNRTVLCNSYVWDCEYTGKSGCTYATALKSEKEAREQLDSLPRALQRTIVTLTHNVIRSGISGLTEELTGYLRERYQIGEAVEYTNKKLQVIVIEVHPPPIPEAPPTPAVTPSNMSSPANGISPLTSSDPSPLMESHISVIKNATTPVVTNKMSLLSNNSQQGNDTKTATTPTGAPAASNSSGKKKSSRHHKVHAIPIAEDAHCLPAAYQYQIRKNDGSLHLVNANTLSRRKGVLTQDKVKFFLKAALYKTNPDNKAPLHVKDEFLKKFTVGESKVFPSQPLQLNDDTDFKSPPSVTSSRKRHLSQSSLDMYFASSFSSSSGSGSAHKKSPKPLGKSEKPLLKKEKKKSPGKIKKPVTAKKSPNKTVIKPSPPKHLILVTNNSNSDISIPVQPTGVITQFPKPQTPRTPVKTPAKTPTVKTPTKSPILSRSSSTSIIMSAKKTRTLKQIREQLRRKFLTTEQRIKLEGEMKRKLDEKKEERKKQLQELREKKLAEKKRLIELMKPREDQLCEDSKTLPEPSSLHLRVPEEHFADVAMLLEFLNTFGPLFEVEEVIQRKITFDLIEEALLSRDVQGPLYDIVKFLLQAVFAAMEEDGELKVSLSDSTGSNCHSPVPQDPTEATDAVSNVDKEVGKEEQDEKQDGTRSKLSDASLHALWSLQHQGVALNELVLNSYTISEVLRLHLLSVGGYGDNSERRTLRYQRRGGYTDKDNPSVAFRSENTAVLDSLQYKSLFDMDVRDRILILKTLCSELLTFTMTRDVIDESKYKWKIANKSYQELLRKEEHRDKKKKITIKKSSKDERKVDHPTKEKQQTETEGSNGVLQQTKEKSVIDVASLPVSQQNGYCSGEEEGNAKSTGTAQLPSREADEEENVIENEEERLQKKEELKSEMLLQLSMSNLKPLGADRLHRKYWLFNSLSGLYVEHDSTQLPPLPTPSDTPSPNGNNSTHNTATNIEQHTAELINAGTISQLPPQELQQNPVAVNEGNKEHHTVEEEGIGGCIWRCYTSEDDFTALLDSLNPRGIREKSLKESLQMHRDRILSTIHKCPFVKSRAEKSIFQGYDANLMAGDYLELCLREQILDLEEKIWLGGLGFAKGERDRDEWRDCIESSGAAKKMEEYHKSGNNREKEDGRTPEQGESCVPKTLLEIAEEQDSRAAAQELAQALLQIEEGIERKYLTAPLGTAVYENKKQKHKKVVIKACLDKWRSSLAVSSNFSQVFLHLFTLERCIAWSRSLLNIRCRVCRRKGGDESMLLCDACDNGYHMYCLRPPLKKVPTGDWFCNDCKPATPVKPRRSTISQKAVLQALSEESSSDETTDYEEDSVQLDTVSSEEEEEYDEYEEIVRRSARLQKQNAADAHPRRRGRPRKVTLPVTKKQHKATTKGKKKNVSQQPAATSGRKRKSSSESDRPSNNKKGRTVQSVGNKLAKITDEIASQYFDQGSTALRGKKKRAYHSLEQKLCRAILTELLGHPDSWPFLETSHQSELHFYEFDNTDLSTLEERVESSQYRLEDFIWDVRTIFLNCPQLHRRNSEASRAGSSLEKYFEGRLMELGIKMDKEQQERKHRQFLYRVLNK